MNRVEREQHVLDLVIPQLEDDGYSVFVQPPASLLPKFMRDYAPDAVAIGKPKNLAIEIVQGDEPEGTKLDAVKQRFDGASDWELRIYYYRPDSNDIILEPVADGKIRQGITTVESLLSAGQPEAALLLGWAALEAVGRALLPERLKRPIAAGRLLERLSAEGVVTPDEADRLRALLAIRNRIAHGDLEAAVAPDQVADLVVILRLALDEADTTAA